MSTSDQDGRDRHERLQRLWWAAPGAVVAGSAIGVAVVVGPTIGQQVAVPHQLVVPAGIAAPSTSPSPWSAHRHRHPRPRPAVTPTPAPAAVAPVQTTRVVQPRRPVVTASAEDGNDRYETPGIRESGDR